MKKFFTLVTGLLFIYSTERLSAQSFSVAHDTVAVADPSGMVYLNDAISTPSATASATIQWKVLNSDFPTDWISGSGICDNNLCYNLSALWPSGTSKTSGVYSGPTGDFHLQINLDAASSLGTYYVKVRMNNQAVPTDTAVMVFKVTKTHNSGVQSVKGAGEVSLYPNPAVNEINVVFDGGSDVRNIGIYNVIGKMMAVYKVNGNSANMDISNMPGGIYFVRLVNGDGNIVATKKFTKQ